jgi:formylglycine-generating enzyme required for sulfatase activity
VALVAGGETVTPIRRLNPGVNPATEAAVAAAMALASSQRLAGAGALREALAGRAVAPLSAVGQTVVVGPRAGGPQVGGRQGGPGWLWVVAGLAVVAIIAAIGFWLMRPENGVGGEATAAAVAQVTETADADSPPTTIVDESTAAATVVLAATETAEPTVAATETPAATATPASRRIVILPGREESTQVLVPAGSFLMGADDDLSEDDEAPIHEVRLDAFYIEETEVTNAQFATFLNREVVDSGPYDSWIDVADEEALISISVLGDGFAVRPGFDRHPVVEVTWNGANAYCAWAGGRLPTEAEWEYAARGPEGRIYPWGDVFECGRLNADDETVLDDYVGPGGAGCDGFNRTAPVGSFPQGESWVGALDMSGNVWEWVNDWYQANYYTLSPAENPPGPVSNPDNLKVVRGGSWFKGYISDRGSFREHNQTTDTLNDVGFRCVYDVAAVTSAPPGSATSESPPVTTSWTVGATQTVADPSGDANTTIYVPAGTFLMGSEDGNNDERPIHEVTLDAFWLDRTEVTNARFADFVEGVGYETTAEAQGWGYLFDGGNWDVVNGANWRQPQGPGSDINGLDEHPVVLVNRADAAAFCAWAGGRLPTEAEWEYAARGPENRLWAWGNEFLADRVNYCDHDCSASWADLDVDDGYTFTAPVDSFPAGASWVGALNMTGNVWEWVADWYAADYYGRSPADNPPGPESGERGIVRGGSWVFESRRARATDRNHTDPTYAINDFGIRCAYDVG